MSKIATQFNVTLDQLLEANAEAIPNPDLIAIGDEVIIPTSLPSEIPNASVAPSPSG